MTKAKLAKTTRAAKSTASSAAKAATKAPLKASASAKTSAKAKAAETHKPDWSRTIRQALQEKQAPKAWPGGGSAPWKGAPPIRKT